MTKLVFGGVTILAIVVGLLVGTLNAQPVTLDLLWGQVTWPLGLVVLFFFSVGLLIGTGLVFFFRVLPLRLQLRRARLKPEALAEPRDLTVGND
ncbi:MAG: LapA family protein [Xanthomonadales bacterium]|nr:LapA family protein [Xanthomonadales bacterium]